MSNKAFETILEHKIVAIVRGFEPETVVEMAKAYCANGIHCVEITFDQTNPEKQYLTAQSIRMVKEALGDAMCVGAGTVMTTEQVDKAKAAGAKFVVTPGLDVEIVKYCQEVGMPIYPGCTTPTDYHAAFKLGLQVLKFFPAEQSGGLAKIKAMAAPFPMFKVMPTGGVSLKNLKEYLSCPVICACGGSYMVTADLIDNGEWDKIIELCKESVKIVKEARNNG